MAAPTYATRALVLKRTKLGETDVICTLLNDTGAQIRAVAKGARKPSSPFASRLEVFSVADLLIAKGKSLDIIKEARLVKSNSSLRSDILYMQAAAPMVDLLDKATQVDLENPRLYNLTVKALELLAEAKNEQRLVLCAAHLVKALSILGFRPSFITCITCGKSFDSDAIISLGPTHSFSLLDGGFVCSDCSSFSETIFVSSEALLWAHHLLFSTFEDLLTCNIPDSALAEILCLLQMWIQAHIGLNLKSLKFLFSCNI